MSLNELLRDSDHYSAWGLERKKLIKTVIGILLATLFFIGGGLFLSTRHSARHDEKARAGETDSKSLAQLMLIQGETKKLQEELSHDNVRRVFSPTPKSSAWRRSQGSMAQIIDYDPGEGFTAVNIDKDVVYLPTGSVFLAQLITPIKTSVERTFVMAETTREFRMDMKRRILKGSRLIGRSRLNPVLKGVIVEFDTLVSPGGIESSMNGLALSKNALPEIEGLYFSDKLETYGVAMAFGFISGFAGASRTTQPTIYGPLPDVNVGNQVLSGVNTAAFQVTEDMLRDIQSRAVEYVIVPAREQIFVVLTRRYDIATKDSK